MRLGVVVPVVLTSMGLLAGCASTKPYSINLMPAPDVYEDGVLDPFSSNDLAGARPETEILYVTDRAPALEGDSDRFYSSERGHVLRLGGSEVALATGELEWEEARRISLQKNRREKYPLSVAAVEEFGQYPLIAEPAACT